MHDLLWLELTERRVYVMCVCAAQEERLARIEVQIKAKKKAPMKRPGTNPKKRENTEKFIKEPFPTLFWHQKKL